MAVPKNNYAWLHLAYVTQNDVIITSKTNNYVNLYSTKKEAQVLIGINAHKSSRVQHK